MKKMVRYLLLSSLLFFAIAKASAQSKGTDRKEFEKHRYKPGKEKKHNRNYKAHKEKVGKHSQTTAREKQKAHEKKLKANKGHEGIDKQKDKEKSKSDL